MWPNVAELSQVRFLPAVTLVYPRPLAGVGSIYLNIIRGVLVGARVAYVHQRASLYLRLCATLHAHNQADHAMNTKQRRQKPHLIFRHGYWHLYNNRLDACSWPFPCHEARTVRAITEAVKRSSDFLAALTKGQA